MLGGLCVSLRFKGVGGLDSFGLVLKRGAAVRARAIDPVCPGEVLSLFGEGTTELFMEYFGGF